MPAGTHSVTAIARDNSGATATSAAAQITVTTPANKPPVVSLTSPANGASFNAPASVTLSATASDSDGTIARVDFFAGGTMVGSDTSSPYSAPWSNVAGRELRGDSRCARQLRRDHGLGDGTGRRHAARESAADGLVVESRERRVIHGAGIGIGDGVGHRHGRHDHEGGVLRWFHARVHGHE